MKFIITAAIYLFTTLPVYSQIKDSASLIIDSTSLIKDSASLKTGSAPSNKDSLSSGKIVLPWFVERFKISAGAFYVVNKTNVLVHADDAEGTDIDLEKDLGINREITTFIVNFQWQISRRSQLALNYYNVNRSSSHVLEKDIIFKDSTYYTNSSVNAFYNTNMYQVSYSYAIFSKPTWEAGLYIGAHIANSKTGISLSGNNNGASSQNSFGFTAPLPNAGMWGSWAISKRFAFNGSISYFAVTINNITGRLLAFSANFTYKIIDQLDVTLGYTGLDYKIDVVRTKATGNFKWGYNGPTLTANFSFGKKTWTH